jgi:DNA-directed RNA polymerase
MYNTTILSSSKRRQLHTTTTQSLAQSALSTFHQHEENTSFDENFDEEIELLTNSCLSQFLPPSLPEEIFYQCGEVEPMNDEESSSLDQELGNFSIWDPNSPYEEEDAIVEEQYFTNTSSELSSLPSFESLQPEMKKSAMEILRSFDLENRPSIDDKEELQLWLECAAQREAVMKYQKLVEKARDRKAFDSMSLMQRHVVQWYQDMRDAIEIRQKEYLSNEDSRRARKRYGPFLCSLHPEKMAVITSHEAITQALLLSGKNGKEGVALVKFAQLIGAAVETEVISQRRMKERFRGATTSFAAEKEDNKDADSNESTEKIGTAIDHWKFSASHLKLYMDELKRIDPKLGKSKRAINYAMRRAKQAMNTQQKWSREDLTHIGSALLSILVENAKVHHNGKEEPAFRVEKRWSKAQKSTSYIVLHDYIMKLFLEDEFLSWAANTTRHKPMIVPPSDWTGPNEGGYRWLQVDLIRTHRSNIQKEALERGDLSMVSDGLNILGKTPWQINKHILEVSEYCWEHNVPIGDIPSRTDLEVPPEPKRPDRIDPEIYGDGESPEGQAAMEANRKYRESMYKRQRIYQKNMVRE